MNKTQMAILAVALTAGGLAALLAGGGSSPPPPPPPTSAPMEAPVARETQTDGVLVLARNLEIGVAVQNGDLTWAEWPRGNIPSELIRRSENPRAIEEFRGAIARGQFLAGEPVRRERLVHTQKSGFLAATLPPGMRAIAIPIEQNGGSTAGGFVLPNDRVDIIATAREGGADGMEARTVLTNLRVLAIGQSIQERNGERVITGGTATLEVDPRQAEILILAQRSGQLSLSLRSIADGPKRKGSEEEQNEAAPEGPLTVVRFGVPMNATRR